MKRKWLKALLMEIEDLLHIMNETNRIHDPR